MLFRSPSPSRIHPVLGETPADDSMNASVPHRSPEPRFFFLPLLAIDRLWLRSRPRGACAALGFASCLSRQAGDCGFLSPSPCQARTQGLGELGARVWRTLLWASVSPPLSDHTSARQNGWDWRHGQRIGWWRAPQFLCGVELSLESRPPRLSCSSSPRTITHLHDPSDLGFTGISGVLLCSALGVLWVCVAPQPWGLNREPVLA